MAQSLNRKTLLASQRNLQLRAGRYRLVLAAILLTGLVSGCAHDAELTPQVASAILPTEALIYPPIGGPGILGIVETTYPNAIVQEISLATEARTRGQNKISVTLFKGKGGDGSDAGLRDVPFTQINLTEEALAAWPDSGMSVSPYYVQNDYGPFGYAVGRPRTGDTCLYAWQRIEPALKPSGAIKRGTVVIRLQLCDRSRSEESLLNVMYQLRLNTPLFEPWAASKQFGRLAMPMKPVGAGGFVPVVRPVPAPVPSRPRQPQPVVAPVIVPPPGAPIIPLPGGSAGAPIVPLPTAGTPSVIVPLPPSGSGQ